MASIDSCNLSGNLSNLLRFDEALAVADQALTLQPEHPLGHLRRAIALNGLQRYAEALAELEASPLPEYQDYREILATALRGLGRTAEAEALTPQVQS